MNRHLTISLLHLQDNIPEPKTVEAVNNENLKSSNVQKEKTEISAYLKTAFWCLDMNALSVSSSLSFMIEGPPKKKGSPYERIKNARKWDHPAQIYTWHLHNNNRAFLFRMTIFQADLAIITQKHCSSLWFQPWWNIYSQINNWSLLANAKDWISLSNLDDSKKYF